MTMQECTNWADKMIEEYEQNRSKLQGVSKRLSDQKKRLAASNLTIPKRLADESTILNSMIESMTYALDWMKTGRDPAARRGVDKRAIYQQNFFASFEMIPDITDELYEPEEKYIRMSEEEKEQLAKIFSSWSHRERYCFIAHMVEQQSLQSIADDLGITKASVQTHVARAKKKVEKVLEK